MKILYISSLQLFPILNGGAQVTTRSLVELGKNNEVDLITVRAQDCASKRELMNSHINIYDYLSDNPIIKFLSPITYSKIVTQIIKQKPNKVIIDFPWFGVIGVISKLLLNIPFEVKSHNVEYSRMMRLRKWFWPILKIYEKIVYSYAEKIICISELDKKILETDLNISPQKIVLEEYLPDPKIFMKNSKTRKYTRLRLNNEKMFIVLFFGPLDYQPNIEAVNIIKEEIVPRVLKLSSNIRFLIVGNNPRKIKSSRNILITGYVNNIEDYINASDVVIVPLLSGGGIRTKIIESIACGKTVVSTPIGAEGINKEAYGEKLIIAKGWDNFTRAIIHVLHSKPRASYL